MNFELLRVSASLRHVVFLLLFCSALPGHAELRIGNGAEPESLDPQRAESSASGNIVNDLFEGLTTLNPAGEVVPGAAERWQIGADGLHYTFFLRPQARWSNGDPVTAEDFVFALRRAVDPATGASFAQLLAPIAGADEILSGRARPESLGVEAPDPLTLKIRLKSPTPYFLGLLGFRISFPVHRPSLAAHGAQFTRPGRLVGNGAYRLREWTVHSHILLERNEHYWDAAHTAVGLVRYIPTVDADAELKRYRAGGLDVTYTVPLLQAPALRAGFGAELRVAPLLGLYYYGFNLTRPPFRDNPKLRQALTMSLDREIIVEKVMNGLATPAYSWVPPGTADYTPQVPEWAGWPQARRLAEARRLYAEAGYTAQKPAEFELRYATQPDARRIATVMAAMWKQALGARVRLINEEQKVFINNVALMQVTQLFRDSWIADYNDASSFTDLLHSAHGVNDMGYAQPRYDELLAQAAREPDRGRRRALLEEAERVALADYPVIPVYFYVSKHLVKPRVQNWQGNVLDLHLSRHLRLAP